ncbi:MAG: NUDIX hydrolase [Planctomycetota bacterium]
MRLDTLKSQSGALPYLLIDGVEHVVLITSHVTGGWVLPKGSIEPGMSSVESAANEALEEAGVLGDMEEEIVGTYRYVKYSTLHEVTMYLLRVTEVLSEWDEMDSRERQIVPLDLAIELVEDNVAPILTIFRDSETG